jgi:NAD(P)-dependent dehydrogenase (short-subunit alcohol dehydrogenase family)
VNFKFIFYQTISGLELTFTSSPNGIGYHTAHHLALHGATVYIGARDLPKALSAIEHMLSSSPTGTIKPRQLKPFVADLGDLKAVKQAALHFMSHESRLDIPINNAGLLARPLDLDENGLSVSFKTNHLAPFVLTMTLLPLLKRTADAHPGVRVVTVSSTTHELPPRGIRFRSIEDFNADMGGKDGMPANLIRYGESASSLQTEKT